MIFLGRINCLVIPQNIFVLVSFCYRLYLRELVFLCFKYDGVGYALRCVLNQKIKSLRNKTLLAFGLHVVF